MRAQAHLKPTRRELVNPQSQAKLKLEPQLAVMLAAARKRIPAELSWSAVKNSFVRTALKGPEGQVLVMVAASRKGGHSMTFSAEDGASKTGPTVALRFANDQLASVRVNPEGERRATYPQIDAFQKGGELQIFSPLANDFVAAPSTVQQLFSEAQALTTGEFTHARLRDQLARIAQLTTAQLSPFLDQVTT